MQEFISSKTGIYYRVNNFQPERKTLVFIHGLIGSSSAWIRYEKRFENEFNILTFDLRGHGKSKKYPKETDYTVEKFVQDVYELITELKIKNFVLISHSFGTIVALEFLRHHANLVTATIFLNPEYKMHLLRGFIMIISCFIPLTRLFPFASHKGGHVDYSRFVNTGDFDGRRILADIKNTSLQVYLYCLKGIAHDRHLNAWRELRLPVLVVHGRKDKISPVANGIAIADMIPGAKLQILENANHITVFNNFEEVSQAIENFIAVV